MISLGTRIYIPRHGLFGRVTARQPIAGGGCMYSIAIETQDGSHVVGLYGSRDVTVALDQDRMAVGMQPVPVPVARPVLRLATVNGVAV